MPKQKFMIAPINSGLQTDLKPFLIPDDAYAELKNMQLFRGRLIKGFGTRYTYGIYKKEYESRCRHLIGITEPGIAGESKLEKILPGVKFLNGQQFSCKKDVASDIIYLTVCKEGGEFALKTTNPNVTGTFDTTNGQLKLRGFLAYLPVNTKVYWYPVDTIQGFLEFNDKETDTNFPFAFDSQFMYKWDKTNWIKTGEAFIDNFLKITISNLWSGNNEKFFNGTMFRCNIESKDVISKYNILFITNNYNFIRYYTKKEIKYSKHTFPTIPAQTVPENSVIMFNPALNKNERATVTIVNRAKFVINFKDRILLFNYKTRIYTTNVVFTETLFTGGVRWSKKTNVLDHDAFYAQGSGWLNAPIEEEITAVYVLHDHCIVFFENSIWELVYTYRPGTVATVATETVAIGDTSNVEFIWKEISTEFGSVTSMGLVPYGLTLLTMSKNGIIATNGASVSKIDSKIPDYIYETLIYSFKGERICGIRDFKNDYIYWGIPYNRKCLVMNYTTGSWSELDYFPTCFGTMYEGASALAGEQYTRIIAGTYRGYIVIPDYNTYKSASDISIYEIDKTNTPTIHIYAKDHNLKENDYVFFESCKGTTGLNGKIYKVTADYYNVDANKFDITLDAGEVLTDTYIGGGLAAWVKLISVKTKDYGFYLKEGMNSYINKISFMLLKTDNGEFSINSFASSSSEALPYINTLSTSSYGGLEDTQKYLWHSIYPQINGQVLSMQFYQTVEEIRNVEILNSPLEIEAMTFDVSAGGEI